MNAEDEFILDACLAKLRNGEDVEACLSAYPDRAPALLPLLLTAEQIRALPQPRMKTEAVQAGQERMLVALAQHPPQAVSATGLARYTERVRSFLVGKEKTEMKPVLRFTLALLVVVVILAPAALMASAHSLPGDWLYPVKRAWEQVRLTFTVGEEAREVLEAELAKERQFEEQALLEVRHITPTLPYPVPNTVPTLLTHLTETPVPPAPPILEHPTVNVPSEVPPVVQTVVSGLLTATPTWLPPLPTDWPATIVWTMPPAWPTDATWEPIPTNWATTPTVMIPPEWLTATPTWIPPIPTDILTAIPTFAGTIPPLPTEWPTVPPEATWVTPDPSANPVPTYVSTYIPTWFPPPPTGWPPP